ncbi:hypothetical protein M9H77_26394 [Catharanthus roseus]|uniref:Uncharacterized protein n=1 Tax=Catharanthus roseus TaxID=4058 RepID=A0ACC0ADL1_CATRO|nr:hypothetical protein M9H77_26394 [Catharanthus roseus]
MGCSKRVSNHCFSARQKKPSFPRRTTGIGLDEVSIALFFITILLLLEKWNYFPLSGFTGMAGHGRLTPRGHFELPTTVWQINCLWELKIYSGNKLLFCFGDSLNLLLGKLKDLARNLYPELGQKGSIPHEEITLSDIPIKKPELINYLRQDILLLGGIMKKAQEIYWTVYNVDIESKIIVSSLALTISRMKCYNASNWLIYIPNMNENSFIRPDGSE